MGSQKVKRRDSVAVLVVGTQPIGFGADPQGCFHRIECRADFSQAFFASRLVLGLQFLQIRLGLDEDPFGFPPRNRLGNRVPVMDAGALGPVLPP